MVTSPTAPAAKPESPLTDRDARLAFLASPAAVTTDPRRTGAEEPPFYVSPSPCLTAAGLRQRGRECLEQAGRRYGGREYWLAAAYEYFRRAEQREASK